LETKRKISLRQYRRREKIKSKTGLTLIVYACMLLMLGYMLVQLLKVFPG